MSVLKRKDFRAVSIGQAALRSIMKSRDGEVHSVFERTFNILIGRELVGVGRSGISLSPIDLVTDIPADKTIPSLGIKKGMPVRMDGKRMLVGDSIVISLEGVKRWRPPTSVKKHLGVKLIARNLELAKKRAIDKDGDKGFGQLLRHIDAIARGEAPAVSGLNRVARKALPHIIDLLRSANSGDMDGVRDAARRLIGLGPGLTPSADDMLTGFTATLWWVSRSLNKRKTLVDRINDAIISQSGVTNLLSRQLLQHAARGEVNQRLGELLKAIFTGKDSEIEPLVERVMKIGETSGIDMMFGLLLGMKLGLEITG
jgi:hypothetical protein